MIARYPSLAAMAAAIETAGHRWLDSFSDSEKCGESSDESLERTRHGDKSLVADAEKLLSQFGTMIEVPHRETIADVCGGWPSVPDYLSGMPDCMRRRAMVPSEAAPINLYVCVSASYEISPKKMQARGVAILALAMALQQIRPVELHVFSIGAGSVGYGEGVVVAPVNSRPLDLATACYALTSAGFYRRVCFGLCRSKGWAAGGWPEGFSLDGSAAWLAGLLGRLGGNPDADIILGPAHGRDPLVLDPVAWVRAQLARHTGDAL